MAMKEVQGLMKPLKKYAKMTLTAVFSSRRKRPAKAPSYEFTHFAIKIDIEGPGWQKIVAKLLGGIHGVSHFNMEDDGTVEISGTVNPTLLLKKLVKAGTRATIKHWQYGKCSSNMYAVPNPYNYNNSNYGRGYDYPSHGGNMYDYPANGRYGYGYPRGNSHYYEGYGGDYYGSAPYHEENGYGYDYPSHGGNMYDYPANGGYGYGYPRGNSHYYARYGGDDYGYAPYHEENGYGYGGYLGSSSHHGHGREYGYY